MAPRLFTTASFVLGVLLFRLAPQYSVVALTLLGLVALWHPRLRTPATLSLALLALLLGLARSRLDQVSEAEPLALGHRTVEGTILEPPRMWGRSYVFFFAVHRVDEGPLLEKPITVLVRWHTDEQTVEVGDTWELSGRFTLGEQASYPGGFDQRQWLWTQHAEGLLVLHNMSQCHFLSPPTGHSPHQLSYRLRAWMMARLQKVRSPNERALVAGVVFGETQSLPRALQDQFRRTGTSHLLAASGMNVALLAGLIMGIANLLGYGPWRAAPLAIPAVIAYAFLAGCGPSITRAATGTTLALLALSWGRNSNAWNTLCLSIWGLLLYDPRQVYDLGFQLSVLAVIGLVAGPKAPKRGKWISENLILTISASLITLPLFWLVFGELSSTLLLANLLLGPIVELLFPLGLLLTLLPIPPLVWVVEKVAALSLFLVSHLSALSDPVLLTTPTVFSGLSLLTATLLWFLGKDWRIRWWALPVIGLALFATLQSGRQPSCPSGHLRVRRVGTEVPYFWLSTHRHEVLVLSEGWQEGRARAMVRQMGCLREPEIRRLGAEPFDFEWGRFRWSRVQPYLPAGPYLELEVTQAGYRQKSWKP